MTTAKTIKIDEETHREIKDFMEKRGISTFGEAVKEALEGAEGIVDETGWIVSTRDTLSGQPRIKGTRIGVLNVAQWYFEEGLSVEEICENYHVEKEGVEAAVEYIEENENEIELLKKEQELAEKASQERAKERLQELDL
ncbi:MAG: DUF433 domain-containing protein [Candidatus Thermoplasmatota archaeon]